VERYEKRAPKKNGKVPPQQLWMDLIGEATETAPGHLKHHIQSMASLDNVPRKEKPFRNFTSNSLNLRGKSGEGTVSEIWNFLKGLREKQQQSASSDRQQKSAAATQQSEAKNDAPVNVEDNSSVEKNEESSPKDASTKEETSDKSKSTIDKKAVKKAMKKALKKASDRSLKIKLLRKAVQSNLNGADAALVKDLVQQNLKHFVVDGKRVTLKAT